MGPIAFTAIYLARRVQYGRELPSVTLYQHAAESFTWVLIYIAYKDVPDSLELERWHDPEESCLSRFMFQSKLERGRDRYTPTDFHKPLFKYTVDLLRSGLFHLPKLTHQDRNSAGEFEQKEIPDEEVGKEFMSCLSHPPT
jgi:hypothetical protein